MCTIFSMPSLLLAATSVGRLQPRRDCILVAHNQLYGGCAGIRLGATARGGARRHAVSRPERARCGRERPDGPAARRRGPIRLSAAVAFWSPREPGTAVHADRDGDRPSRARHADHRGDSPADARRPLAGIWRTLHHGWRRSGPNRLLAALAR